MYWIPSIFIVFELLFFFNLVEISKFTAIDNFKKNQKKKKERELSDIELSVLPEISKPMAIFAISFGFVILLTVVYWIVGLFYPFWYISLGVIIMMLISYIYGRIFPSSKHKYDCFLELDKIDNVTIQRRIKLNALKNHNTSGVFGNFKNQKTKILLNGYFWSFYRLSTYLSIIILHYHFELI